MADDKLKKLHEIIRQMGSVAIAFSGGLDSSFLLRVASDILGDKAMAITATSPTYSKREFEEAKRFCGRYGIKQTVIESSEMDIPEFRKNPKERCYICKKDLFAKCLDVAKDNGMSCVADGANVDDLSDYRPGDLAAKELGIRRPLLEAGLNKEDIRKFSRQLKLETSEKPSYACMASRFPYGEEIDEKKLGKISILEDFIRDLGFRQVRVRHHKDVARIEVGPEEMEKFFGDSSLRKKISAKARQVGYIYVSLDLEGYRTGSMNESE